MVWILLLLTFISGTFLSPYFLSKINIVNILEHASILGVLVIGQSLCWLSGNFDMSSESLLGFTGMLGAWLITASDPPALGSGLELNPIIGLIVIFGVGIFIGVINGILITKLKLNNFITTLAMMITLRGATMVINEGITVTNIPESFLALGHNTIGSIPISIIVMLALFVISHIVARYTQFGRNLYVLGGNRDAAIAAGIDADKTTVQMFIISGMFSTLAGWMYVGRIASANALMGEGMIFDINAACVVGGISIFGRKGNMIGALAGVILLSMITSILQLMGISAFWIDIFRGSIILFAMFIDAQKQYLQKPEFASSVISHSKIEKA